MLHKIIKKAGPDLHIFLNSVVLLGALVALVLFAFVVWKHTLLKNAVRGFISQGEIVAKQKFMGADATEDGKIVAITIGRTPSTKPLFTDKKELQDYVTAVSQLTSRDIVVLDKNKIVLADTIKGNVGTTYNIASDQINETLQDELPRRFVEKSKDYPDGIDLIVVPIKDANGAVMGALLMSTSTIFED